MALMNPTHRTITLTGRPPVRLVDSDWPMIAHGLEVVTQRDGTPLRDYESARWDLRVRQHADGRAIVYGVADAPSGGWPTHGARDWRGGELLPPGSSVQSIVEAIERVGRDLVDLGGAPEPIIRETIAALPAEEI